MISLCGHYSGADPGIYFGGGPNQGSQSKVEGEARIEGAKRPSIEGEARVLDLPQNVATFGPQICTHFADGLDNHSTAVVSANTRGERKKESGRVCR